MKIIVNGDARDVNDATLDAVLAQLGFGDSVVATAVNGEFVSAFSRPETLLNDGDRVEVLAPMQGG
jgi:sulfur carrier protein